MTDAVSSVASLDNLSRMQSDNAARELDRDAFMNAFDQGLDTLSQRPNPQEDMSPVEEFSGIYSGEVGAEKTDILSETGASSEDAADASAQTMEQRFQSLYFELTHYQVAWKIAQNVQRDLSQVLRGS